MASGRFGALVIVSILLLCSATPLVSAHGANTMWIIARGTYLQPDAVEVVQNDTVEIHNSAELNRTVQVDFDGDGLYNGTNDVYCNLNSSEYCSFWLDPANWSAGQWDVEIIEENGSTMYARITIQADIHVTGNPLGYQFGMDDDDEMEVEASESHQNWIQMIAVISGLTGILLLITLMNKRNGSGTGGFSMWAESEMEEEE